MVGEPSTGIRRDHCISEGHGPGTAPQLGTFVQDCDLHGQVRATSVSGGLTFHNNTALMSKIVLIDGKMSLSGAP